MHEHTAGPGPNGLNNNMKMTQNYIQENYFMIHDTVANIGFENLRFPIIQCMTMVLSVQEYML